jgi:hypothetical protein
MNVKLSKFKHWKFSQVPENRTPTMYTYHSRFIPEGAAEASQISPEMPVFYQNYLAMSNTADVTSGT